MMKRLIMTDCVGSSFAEVLVAMAILPLVLMGAIGAFHMAERIITLGTLSSRALAMAQSRIEAKRSVRWERLLMDDLDYDGIPETLMHDDGQDGDLIAGDGVYSATAQRNGVSLTWTVIPSRTGRLSGSGYAVIESRASYETEHGQREVKLVAIRANPVYVGE